MKEILLKRNSVKNSFKNLVKKAFANWQTLFLFKMNLSIAQ